jgi:hypothetical protein
MTDFPRNLQAGPAIASGLRGRAVSLSGLSRRAARGQGWVKGSTTFIVILRAFGPRGRPAETSVSVRKWLPLPRDNRVYRVDGRVLASEGGGDGLRRGPGRRAPLNLCHSLGSTPGRYPCPGPPHRGSARGAVHAGGGRDRAERGVVLSRGRPRNTGAIWRSRGLS